MYTEQTSDLGSLKSFFKKVVKIGAKLSPSHQLLKKIAPKAMIFSPSQMLLASSSPKSKPTIASAETAPAPPPITQTSPAAVDLSQASPFTQQPASFSGGGGSSGPAPSYADQAQAAPAETDLTPWILAAAAIGAFFLLRKK